MVVVALLTVAQKEYFKDSKLRDDNGQLVVCMHRTNHEFTAFDKDKITDDSYCGRGFYFTSRTDFGTTFGGKTLKCYLNITKPLILDSLDSYEKSALLDYFARSEAYQRGDLPRVQDHPQQSEEYSAYYLDDILRYHAFEDEDLQAEITEFLDSYEYNSFVESGNIEDINDSYTFNRIKRNKEFMQAVSDRGIEDYLELEILMESDLNFTRFHYGAWNDFAKLLTEYAQQNSYDGILLDLYQGRSTEIVVFEPNQIKSIDNLNPTLSDDFREAGNISEAPDSLDSLIAAAEGQKQPALAKPIFVGLEEMNKQGR